MSAGLMAMLATALFGLPRPQNARRDITAKRSVRDPQHPSARLFGEVWWLHPCHPDCPAARALGGRRLPTERTIPLPLQSSGDRPCSCRYRPLVNQRGRERRSGVVRRYAFRLDQGADRRQNDRRRSISLWDGRTLR